MSHEYNAQYELERKRREELERKRAAEYSERMYKEIVARYEQMKNNEYDAYIPDEMDQLAQNIKNISQYLQSDVFAARNLCNQVQDSLRSMDFLVKSAKEEFARQECLRYEEIQRQKEETKSKLETAFYDQLAKIKNPAVKNFAVHDLEIVKTKIKNGEIVNEAKLFSQIKEVCIQADEKAKKWKEEKFAKEKIAIITAQIDDAVKSVESEKFENEDNKNNLINEMKKLKDSVTKESSETEITEKLDELRTSVDNSLVDEEVRREAVKAIIKELKSQEFTVEKPKIIGTGKDSYVCIKAKKPSGKQAICKINLEGKLNYRFDQYEGMTCLKDIEKFNVDLEKIYSIKLSDERVIWENPDRLSRTQSVSSDSDSRSM